MLKNSHETKALEVVTQDYLIGSMKPYMHELSIRVRFFKDETSSAKFIGQNDFSVTLDYVRGPDSGSSENVITIRDLVVPPQAELIITFGVKKSMI